MAESREMEDFDGCRFSYCLISRRCRLHVGPRYKARGLNEAADPGNEIECDQVVWKHSTAAGKPLAWSRCGDIGVKSLQVCVGCWSWLLLAMCGALAACVMCNLHLGPRYKARGLIEAADCLRGNEIQWCGSSAQQRASHCRGAGALEDVVECHLFADCIGF
jgi:hypothetical protein